MRVSQLLFATLFCLALSAPAWGRPPYAVVGYCYTTTKASSSSLTGSGGNINWSTDIPWNDLTVIADAFMIPNTDDSFSNGGAKNAALVNAAHAQGVRCIVSIGGGGQDGSFTTLCLPANRAAFAAAVASLVTQYGYDGADIDWEQNTNQQADATMMMEDIYNDLKALPPSSVDNKSITLSFTTVDYIDTVYNMNTLANYTDWCFFMGYDWYACPSLANGPLNGEQGEITALTNGSTWSYPISKMVLGCPLYTNDYNPGACTANEYSTLSILHLGSPGAYNGAWAEQAYTAPNGDTVYVDTAQSYCDKISWALGAGLMGVGMWDLGLALPYTDGAVSGIWNTIGGQAACLNLGTPTPTPTPVVASTWRVVAGGPAYTDSQGHAWAADENYSGGSPATSALAISGAQPAAGDQALYQDQRYGASFSYSFHVPPGSYQVTLKFAETYWTAAGQRVFNVGVNGSPGLTNFDIFAAAGGADRAVDEIFDNLAPLGGVITLQFGPASADNAMVDAIQVIPEPATPTPTRSPSRTATATASPSATASASPSRTATASPSASASPAISPSATPSATVTLSPGLTLSPTPSVSALPTLSPSPAASASPSPVPRASLTFTVTATATATTLATPTVTTTATTTATAMATATATVTATATATAMPATDTATATVTATATQSVTAPASPSATLTGTPTETASPPATATPRATASPSPPPSLPTPSVVISPSPGGEGGPLVIRGAEPVPNPNPVAWWVDLEGPADGVTVELYSPAMVRVLVLKGAGGPSGWLRVPLPAGWSRGLARGLYFCRIQARRGGVVSPPRMDRTVLL